MKIYQGRRRRLRPPSVTVDGSPLNPRTDVLNHSTSGFEWGYGGSGPAQLAFAILADHLPNIEEALDLCHRFKWAVIAELPHGRWTLSSDQINATLQTIREPAEASP